MFTPDQFRAKAREYEKREAASTDAAESLDFRKLRERFTALADNEQWLLDNYEKTIHPAADGQPLNAPELNADEERFLRYLGAAVVMQWDSLPATLRREIFDNAGAMGDISETAENRGKIARFLRSQDDRAD